MSHTQGPWKGDDTVVLAADGSEVANTLTASRRYLQEIEANTRLISAAPDLLAALRCIVADLPINKDWLDPELEAQARAAIAKAEGK